MKVLALNSSARTGGQSKTELMLSHLVEGMHEAGADVDGVNLREKNIKNCAGCFSCMTKTPGKCVLKDDMTGELFPKWLESDLIIYATPLFHHTVNATMKTFIERTFRFTNPSSWKRRGAGFTPFEGSTLRRWFFPYAVFPRCPPLAPLHTTRNFFLKNRKKGGYGQKFIAQLPNLCIETSKSRKIY